MSDQTVSYKYQPGDVLLRRSDFTVHTWGEIKILSLEAGKYRGELTPRYIVSQFNGLSRKEGLIGERMLKTEGYRSEAFMLPTLEFYAAEALIPLAINATDVVTWYQTAFSIPQEAARVLQQIPPTGLISCTSRDLWRSPAISSIHADRKLYGIAEQIVRWNVFVRFLKGVDNGQVRQITLEQIERFLQE